MSDSDFAQLRRSPFGGGDLNAVFSQLDTVASVPMSANEDIGLTPEVVSFVYDGMLNANFRTPPPDASANLDDITNKLPGWSFVQLTGTTVTAMWVATDYGGKVTFTGADGTNLDEAYLEQVTPVEPSGSATNREGYVLRVNANQTAGADVSARSSAQFLKDDLTTTGASTTETSAGDTSFATTADTTGSAPTDAAYLRVRFGIRRTATNATVQTWDFSHAEVEPYVSNLYLIDQTDPSTWSVASIAYNSGNLRIATDPDGTLELDASRTDIGGGLVLSGIIWASVTASQDDYSPTGWQTCSTLVLDPDAARNITGFAAPTGGVGTLKHIYNLDDTFDITLVHASGSSSASNQIYGRNNADMVLRPRGGVTLMYFGASDGSALRWRTVSEF